MHANGLRLGDDFVAFDPFELELRVEARIHRQVQADARFGIGHRPGDGFGGFRRDVDGRWRAIGNGILRL